jgi:hypothetical protein
MATLTAQQKTTLHDYVVNDPVLSIIEPSSDAINKIVTALQQPKIPFFYVWNPKTSVSDIYDAIQWSKFTPNDIADTTILYQNRALVCQLKHEIIQSLLLSRSTFDSNKAKQVQGLQDALTNIPAGVAGANVNAGWTDVKLVLSRPATVSESLFATGTGTQASPGTLVLNEVISYMDVLEFMAWG